MAKPDAQTVAQMAATIASGLAATERYIVVRGIDSLAVDGVRIARAIVAEVKRAETREFAGPEPKATRRTR